MAAQVETRPRPLTSAETEPREQIVEASGVVKTYHTGKVEVHALRGVTLGVGRGEMVAIMGPSGSGKTTLLNCLSGLDSINGGDVRIEGVSLAEMSDRERTDYRARRMGFVFQFYNLMPVLSSVENVELPLLVAGVSVKEARRKALEALDLVGLREWAEHVPDELSGGQRQRVTIARALVNNPAIVWADEPTGDLDSENADEIVALMRELNREHGLTFLIVTHDIGVGRKTDRIVRMVDGQIVSEETLAVAKHPSGDGLAPAGRRRIASSSLTATRKVDGQIVSEEKLEVAR
jgi:ABC-type lipoprotein export system ATPase subunit